MKKQIKTKFLVLFKNKTVNKPKPIKITKKFSYLFIFLFKLLLCSLIFFI